MNQITQELDILKKEDQYVKNQKLASDISNIESTYRQAVNVYEDLLRLKEVSKNTRKFDETFADVLTLLAAAQLRKSSKYAYPVADGYNQRTAKNCRFIYDS